MTMNIKDMLEDKNGITQRRKIHRYPGLWNDLIRSSCGWCHPHILEGQPTSSDTRRTDLLALVALAVCRNVEVLFGKDIFMRTCDVAIIGLGLMGSSALHSLSGRGADVLGFDPLIVGEARGSSHGSCRVYRRFNFESEAYTDLSDRAFEGWRGLESTSGRTIPHAPSQDHPPGCRLVQTRQTRSRSVRRLSHFHSQGEARNDLRLSRFRGTRRQGRAARPRSGGGRRRLGSPADG